MSHRSDSMRSRLSHCLRCIDRPFAPPTNSCSTLSAEVLSPLQPFQAAIVLQHVAVPLPLLAMQDHMWKIGRNGKIAELIAFQQDVQTRSKACKKP